MSLSNKALLVNLSISKWTGRRSDRAATKTVETTHGVQHGVGKYTKNLLPGARELQEIHGQEGAIRAFYYEQTLPWFTDGSRILSSKNYMDFTAEFRKRKANFEIAVEAFLAEYPRLREEAKAKLGDLFRETEYPTVGMLRFAFACEINFLPMPDVGDFRTEILDSEKQEFLNRMADVERGAVRDCWYRLKEVVEKAAVTLQNPDAIFRNSLIDNIGEICQLLPKLNVTDDAALEATRQQVESLVAGISAGACRESPHARSDAAKQLDEISNKMSAFMGAI